MKSACLKIALLLICFPLCLTAWSQTKMVSGKVTSGEDSQPLSGVSVIVKNKSIGTQTAGNGEFSIEASSNDILVFSYSGYAPQEVQVGISSSVNISLKAELAKMDEVVVVGYGTQSRRNVTSSVSKMDKEVLANAPRSNVGSALQGTVSGLQAVNATGQPGAGPILLLRGGASINSPGAPLVVIDGTIRSYNDIASEDIASIELLKDAASTAIYGARDTFKSVDTSSLVDKVEASLVELLLERKLRVGDVIPKEIELSEALGVSRTVIREALTRLRLMGLIESKKKKGSVITSPDLFGMMSKSMNPHILDQDTLREIFEIRLVLEIGMADLIFKHITREDIEELKKIVSNEPPATQYHLFNIEHEIAFHGKLYEITGNNTMKKFQKMLLPVFDYVHNSGLLKKQPMLKTFVSHKGLVDILEDGTPELFRNAMRNHLENHFARLFS